MYEAGEKFRVDLAEGVPPLGMTRVGLHVGDAIVGQRVVNRKRETLRKRPLEATVGFMDASIDPQRFDVCGEAVIEVRAKTRLL
jgi:hypothetical protein